MEAMVSASVVSVQASRQLEVIAGERVGGHLVLLNRTGS
jgi:hypothetical protein